MIFFDAQGQPVELGEKVGQGGEAAVYRVANEYGRLAKIYQPAPRPNYTGKLGWMVRYPPENPTAWLEHASLAWPGGLLYDSKNGAKRQLKGYWMPYIQRAVPILEVFNPRRRAEILPQFDRRYLLRTARNLAAALSALHKSGYVAGDLNESNILVTQTALVTLIDTDSFQVREDHEGSEIYHPCPVGKPEYTPPELQGKALAEVIRKPDHDAFGLAVLIFQLLMDGSHPFRAQWLAPGDPPPLEVRIANGAYPYLEAPAYPIRPPRNAPGIDTLHPWLVDLFRRCFVDGHRDPRWRPNPDLWVRTLTDVEQSLILCSEGHYYFSHLESCPYCAAARERLQAQAQQRAQSKHQAQPQAAPRFGGRRSAWGQRPRSAPPGPVWQAGKAAPHPAAPAGASAAAGAARTPTPAPAQPAKVNSAPAASGGRPAWATSPAPATVPAAAPAAAPAQANAGSAASTQSSRPNNPSVSWAGRFAPAASGSASGINLSPGGSAAVFPYTGVLRTRTAPRPGALQDWVRLRAYKTISIGGGQGALIGTLPGIGIGLASWSAGQALPWALLFSLGGAAGGLARGWAPGHKMASLIGYWIGWKRFWEGTGLLLGAIGGLMLGMLLAWLIVPVFLGLILGAQGGLYLGRKLYQVGDLLGWERIWGTFSAGVFGLLGYGAGQLLGVAFQSLLGVYLNSQMLPALSMTFAWALLWMLVAGSASGLGGALAGILADLIGRFTNLVD